MVGTVAGARLGWAGVVDAEQGEGEDEEEGGRRSRREKGFVSVCLCLRRSEMSDETSMRGEEEGIVFLAMLVVEANERKGRPSS